MTIAQDKSDPTGVREDRKGGSSTAVVRARERKANAALQLKKDNCTWDEIAEVLGYPTARHALIAVEQMLEQGALTQESQEFMRHLAGRKLEDWLYVLDKDIRDDSPDRFVAITKSRDLLETHMRLFGYAKPTEVAIYNPLESEVTEFIAAVVAARDDGKSLREDDIFSAEPDDDGVYTVSNTAADIEEATEADEPAEDYTSDF